MDTQPSLPSLDRPRKVVVTDGERERWFQRADKLANVNGKWEVVERREFFIRSWEQVAGRNGVWELTLEYHD